MAPVSPTWFKQRQAKAEPAGENTYRLTGPNLRETFISIRQAAPGRWAASLRYVLDGPEIATTEPEFDSAYDAWEAAFELYRSYVIF
jgi:hypothetical protein